MKKLDRVFDLAECTVAPVAQPSAEFPAGVAVVENEGLVTPIVWRLATKLAHLRRRPPRHGDHLRYLPGLEGRHTSAITFRVGFTTRAGLSSFFGQERLPMSDSVFFVRTCMGFRVSRRVTTGLSGALLREFSAPLLDLLIVTLRQTGRFLGIWPVPCA